MESCTSISSRSPTGGTDGAHRAESDRVRHALLGAAEVLHPRHLKVTPDGENQPWDRAHWAAKFAELAAQADGVGARLGIEFFPWANVSSLHDGLRLVEEAGQEAGTLFQDTVNRRRYCGEGAFDLAGMVAALRTGGRPGRGAWRSRPTSTGRCPSRRRWPARPRARVAC